MWKTFEPIIVRIIISYSTFIYSKEAYPTYSSPIQYKNGRMQNLEKQERNTFIGWEANIIWNNYVLGTDFEK